MSMVDSYTIAQALRDRLQNNATLAAELAIASKAIEINQYANTQAENAPWVGVYLRSATTAPHTTARGYLSKIHLAIVTQASSLVSPDDCTKVLCRINKLVEDVLTTDQTLKATVDMISDIKTDYTYVEGDRESLYFQMAVIDITAEVRKNART